MPVYVYGCPRCDIIEERLRPMELADFPPVECSICHGLCAREVTSANVLRGADPQVYLDHDASEQRPALHEPGCPCCRRSA